jgi:hypothetical protein
MSAPVGHDLSGIIKWCAREEWRPHVDAVMAEHFEPAIEAFRMTFEAIGDALGGSWDMTLWGCAFEDFLTRRFGPNDENPVEGLPPAPRLEGTRHNACLYDRVANLRHEPLRGERYRAGPVVACA